MGEGSGLVHACVLDGKGGCRFIDWAEIRAWTPEQGVLWIHLDFRAQDARTWLLQESGLDEVNTTALLADETRPRSIVRPGGLLLNLRGVNLNPGAQPDDMIALRLWFESKRVITLRRRQLKAVRDVKKTLEMGTGPVDVGDFLVDVNDAILKRMAQALTAMDERIDAIDERILAGASSALRTDIAHLRRQIIAMRRYLAPQREAVTRLYMEKVDWLTEMHRERLHEIGDRTTRRIEDLDAARDRAAVAHEELAGRLAEQMNRTMYVLAIVAGLFLPLGLLTGLLGINVGGMPGVDSADAFWVVCGLLVVVASLQYWIFKRMRWL